MQQAQRIAISEWVVVIRLPELIVSSGRFVADAQSSRVNCARLPSQPCKNDLLTRPANDGDGVRHLRPRAADPRREHQPQALCSQRKSRWQRCGRQARQSGTLVRRLAFAATTLHTCTRPSVRHDRNSSNRVPMLLFRTLCRSTLYNCGRGNFTGSQGRCPCLRSTRR